MSALIRPTRAELAKRMFGKFWNTLKRAKMARKDMFPIKAKIIKMTTRKSLLFGQQDVSPELHAPFCCLRGR